MSIALKVPAGKVYRLHRGGYVGFSPLPKIYETAAEAASALRGAQLVHQYAFVTRVKKGDSLFSLVPDASMENWYMVAYHDPGMENEGRTRIHRKRRASPSHSYTTSSNELTDEQNTAAFVKWNGADDEQRAQWISDSKVNDGRAGSKIYPSAFWPTQTLQDRLALARVIVPEMFEQHQKTAGELWDDADKEQRRIWLKKIGMEGLPGGEYTPFNRFFPEAQERLAAAILDKMEDKTVEQLWNSAGFGQREEWLEEANLIENASLFNNPPMTISEAFWDDLSPLAQEALEPVILGQKAEEEEEQEQEPSPEPEPEPTTNGKASIDAEELQKLVDIAVAKALSGKTTVEHVIVVKQPGGQAIITGQRPHKNLPLLVALMNERMNIMLVGPAGSGKTTGARMAAEVLKMSYDEQSLGPATSQWDLIGYKSPVGDYVIGKLRPSYENGGVLSLDEIDNANPSVLTALNSAISGRAYSFPDKMVGKHKDFVILATANTYGRGADRMYVGRNQLDAATLDRFAVLPWDYDEEAEYDWAKNPTTLQRDQDAWVKYVQEIRGIAFQNSIRVIVSPRASIYGATLLRAGIDRNLVEDIVLWKGMNKDDRQKITANLRR